jgi:FeS assembly SUF system regulator
VSEYYFKSSDMMNAHIMITRQRKELSMLRIGKLTDYGLVVLNQLALAGAVKQSTYDISHATGLTVPTVRKVMKAIVDAGLVIAQRGSKGGYRIARAPTQISVLDVVQAFEGPISLTECSADDNTWEITESCSLASNLTGINDLLLRVLGDITLDDIRNPDVQDTMHTQIVNQLQRIQLVNI